MAVYACADLHGNLNLYKQIKAFLKPEDIVYFLGDATDRGDEPWKLAKMIYTDNQFIYIKGNHEDMLVSAGREFYEFGFIGLDTQHLYSNGGERTFEQWLEEDYKKEWLNCLDKLPLQKTYVNKDGFEIILTHAGFTPGSYQEMNLLWDRSHFNDEWWNGSRLAKVIIVHGHTPIYYMSEEEEVEPGAYWYCDNHKINIDNGTYATGFTCLLDLDTFDEHIFYDKEI